MPGFIDIHAHWGGAWDAPYKVYADWEMFVNLAFGMYYLSSSFFPLVVLVTHRRYYVAQSKCGYSFGVPRCRTYTSWKKGLQLKGISNNLYFNERWDREFLVQDQLFMALAVRSIAMNPIFVRRCTCYFLQNYL